MLSGAELALLRLIPALDDVDAHVILGADGPLVGELRRAGISVEVLPLGAAGRRSRESGAGPAAALAVAPATRRLARRLRELRPDLVHTNSLKANLYGGVAARLAGVPVVWHQHDRLAADYLPARTASVPRRMADRVPDAVIACSRIALATLELRRRPGTAIPSVGAVVPHGAEREVPGVRSWSGAWAASHRGRVSTCCWRRSGRRSAGPATPSGWCCTASRSSARTTTRPGCAPTPTGSASPTG